MKITNSFWFQYSWREKFKNIFTFFANRPIIDSHCGNHRQKIQSLDLAYRKPTTNSWNTNALGRTSALVIQSPCLKLIFLQCIWELMTNIPHPAASHSTQFWLQINAGLNTPVTISVCSRATRGDLYLCLHCGLGYTPCESNALKDIFLTERGKKLLNIALIPPSDLWQNGRLIL